MSIGYMLFRALGGKVEGTSLPLTNTPIMYFAVHGAVALLVISLEIGVLTTGLWQWRQKAALKWHGKLSKTLFVFWWFAFITGETFYIITYIM